MQSRLYPRCFLVAFILVGILCAEAHASNVGRRLPSEKRTTIDKVTGLTLTFLTTDPANDAKPYQTHTTWTSDGKWIIFRSDRGGGSQAFLVNEQTGDIIQLTDGPASGTGSLNLSRKTNKLYLARGGPSWNPVTQEIEPAAAPRQLVEINLDPLIADAMAGKPKEAAAYERIICTLPEDLRDAGGLALDADETKIYWGVSWGPPPPRPPRPPRPEPSHSGAPGEPPRRQIDDQNMDPNQSREVARQRFAEQGKGPGGIRSIDLKTGEIKTVIDVGFRMGHVQTNPWVPGEIIYCHETTGDGPQRMWTVRADGSGNRPLYVETPDEWITHETVATKDEVMFNIMGHLPYLREHPTGIAVINLRTNQMKLLGQVEDVAANGHGTGGFWHCNGSPDGNWAVGDTFAGNVYLIDRHTGERILLTTDHKMKPDHAHPIFSADSRRVAIQSGSLTDGKSLDIMVVDVPSALLKRYSSDK